MHEVVAVKILLVSHEPAYFLTRGRIQSNTDASELLALVHRFAARMGLQVGNNSASLCTLNEASKAEYFYESFFDLCQTRIPYGDDYEQWRAEVAARMQEGREISFLSPQ